MQRVDSQQVDSAATSNNSGENENNNQDDGNFDYNFDDVDVSEYIRTYSGQMRQHSLETNIFGVYCTAEKCAHNRLLQTKGSNLWIPSHNLIREHWKKNECGGDTPNALGAEKSLKAKQIALHNQLMRSTPQQVDSLIAAEFPPNCTILGGTFHYCLNCGVFGNRKSNVERHFKNKLAKSTKCNASQHLKAGGQILVGIHGIKCPQAVVELVRKKQFKLPYHHAAANEPNPNPNPNPTPIIASTPSSRRHQSKFAQFYFL